MELVLEKYDFQVKNRFRARGALLFDTDQGPKLLREYEELGNHFMWENEIKDIIVPPTKKPLKITNNDFNILSTYSNLVPSAKNRPVRTTV